MRSSLGFPLAAATMLACCSGPTEPVGALDGVWMLDTSTAGVPPRQMTLVQAGTRITGTGTAMGVDAPIPVSVAGTYIAANPAGPASVTLAFNSGRSTKAFAQGSAWLFSKGVVVVISLPRCDVPMRAAILADQERKTMRLR